MVTISAPRHAVKLPGAELLYGIIGQGSGVGLELLADLGSTTGINVVGDSTQGAQAGDRNLAASVSEVLCIQASLPTASGNSLQNVSSTATLDFIAEQSALKLP